MSVVKRNGIIIIGAADKVYSKVHKKSYGACDIIIIREKMRVNVIE